MSVSRGAEGRAGRSGLTGHEYDGIQEYDNPTPGWWHAILIGTVIFSAFYALYWHGNPDAQSIQQALATRELRETRKQFAALGDLAPDEATMLRMMGQGKWMAVAEGVFRSNCVACHGGKGEGLVGPNLTDDYWKNVKQMADICRVVSDGANAGAMPGWKNRLQPNEIVLVSAYVASLRGRNLPGRPHEGEQVPPWPAAPRPDPAAGAAASMSAAGARAD
jgi:cytochrome c oxidase cbb3-type subunit 3